MAKEKEVAILLHLIENKTGYTLRELQNSNRKAELVATRRIFFAVCWNLLELPLKEIGLKLKRDRTTISYSLKVHNSELYLCKDYASKYYNIYKSLKVLCISETDYDIEYMQKQIEFLEFKRTLLNQRIMDYWDEIRKRTNNQISKQNK